MTADSSNHEINSIATSSDQVGPVGPWRDGRRVVFDLDASAMPSVCLRTGKPAAGEPRPITVTYFPVTSWPPLILLLVILVVPRLAGEIAIDSFGLWIGIAVLVAVSFMCAHFLAWLWQRTYGMGTWIESWTIPAHMAMTKPPLSWLALTAYFVAAPLAATLSLAVLFTSQTKVVNARNEVEITTFACLFVFAVSVGFFFWGLFRKRDEKPHDVPLKAWKRQGRRIWISGIHRSIVEQLPPYAR